MIQATPLLAIPNVSEGRDRKRIQDFAAAVESGGARVLDVHSDPRHHRSVITAAGDTSSVTESMTELARACLSIDLTSHSGVHPRLGGLDVCPIVPHDATLEEAVTTARALAESIGRRVRLPVYLYGRAARREATAELPELRRGGLRKVIERSKRGLEPDAGPSQIDPARGVVCVGARGPLIAFNVWLACDVMTARSIAAAVRAAGGGLPGVRALGLPLEQPRQAQVSMNIVEPDVTSIDEAFGAVAALATAKGVEIVNSEIVGLVPERYLPAPGGQASRLLIEPARSLESVLSRL